jgi:hypothetical protein
VPRGCREAARAIEVVSWGGAGRHDRRWRRQRRRNGDGLCPSHGEIVPRKVRHEHIRHK